MVKRLQHEDWQQRNSEPWRLRCPSCDSTRWKRKVAKPKTRRINWYGKTEVQHENRKTPMTGQYWCLSCEEQSVGLYDVREDILVCRTNDYVPQEIIKHEPSAENVETAPSANYRASVSAKSRKG